MAKIALKQLDSVLSGSMTVSGSSIVTGSLTVTQLGRFSDVQVTDDLNVTDDVGIGGVLTATGGTVLGNANSDTHTIIGHVTSSGNISSSAASTASFGTFLGDGSQLTGITSVTTSSIQNLGIGIISGSSQLPSGIISGSSQLPSGIISGSSQLPSGVISGSSQLPSGIISGSTQILSAVTSSADIIGNRLVIGGGTFTSASLSSGGGCNVDYNGNRRVLNTNLRGLFSASFNPGTSGSVQNFLDAVFYPNTPPSVSSSNFIIDEFVDSGSQVGTITATDAEALSSEVSFATQSSYSADFFKIHSGSGLITTNTSTSASFNTVNRGDGQLAHPFLVEVSDTITTATATIFIRVTPNTAPNFRTTSTSGAIITSQTGSVNENTTNGTTVLTFFVTDEEDDTITISPLSQSAANRFSLATSNVSGGKRLVITTNTGSFDFETIEKHHLFVSASDQHHGNTSGSYLTTLPIVVNVTDNNAPTMASQVFTINESSGSHTQHGLGTSTNSLTTVGTITTNDTEGDTVTFTALTLTSGSGGSNANQSNPSNNPFQVASNGTLQLKAGQYLNSDIFNQYK